MENKSEGICPFCSFDYKKIKPQQPIFFCPDCGESCADITNNYIRVIELKSVLREDDKEIYLSLLNKLLEGN